jgi:hypothetical protein
LSIVVHEGADLSQVILETGASQLELIGEGSLSLSTGKADRVWQKPRVIYPGAEKKVFTELVTYKPLGEGKVGFQLESTAPVGKVIIQPGITWSTYLDVVNFSNVEPRALALTQSDRIIFTGNMTEYLPELDVADQTTDLTNSTASRASHFIAGFKPDRSGFDFITFIGGAEREHLIDMEVGSEGEIFLYTSALGSGDAITPDAYSYNPTANDGRYIRKLSPNGDHLIYSAWVAPRGSFSSGHLVLDEQNRVIFSGGVDQDLLTVTDNAFQPNFAGEFEGFVGMLNEDGSDLVFASYLGGSDDDFIADLSLDAQGQIHVVGSTRSWDFPPANVSGKSGLSYREAFLSIISPEGSQLITSQTFGGNRDDFASSIALDSNGLIYVAGLTRSTDFPGLTSAHDRTAAGDEGFITQFDAQGNLIRSTLFGGDEDESFTRILIDLEDRPIAIGFSNDPSRANQILGSDVPDQRNLLLTRFNPDLDQLEASISLGGERDEFFYDAKRASNGNLMLLCDTDSSDFPITENALQSKLRASSNSAFAELDAALTQLVYATYMTHGYPQGYSSIAADDQGNLYVVGAVSNSQLPQTHTSLDPSFNGIYDGLIYKLSSDGRQLLYATYIGGNSSEFIRNVVVKPNSEVVIVGQTWSEDFPITADAFQPGRQGSGDGFVAVINGDGTDLLHSTFLGGTEKDDISFVQIDENHAIYISGTTESLDFPNTPGAYDTTVSEGYTNSFTAKLDATVSNLIWSSHLSNETSSKIQAMKVNNQGEVFVAGETNPDFLTTPGAYLETTNNHRSIFAAKFTADGSQLGYATFLSDQTDTPSTLKIFDMVLDPNDNLTLLAHLDPEEPGAVGPFSSIRHNFHMIQLNATGSAPNFKTRLPHFWENLSDFHIARNSDGSFLVVGILSDFVFTAGTSVGNISDSRRGLGVIKWSDNGEVVENYLYVPSTGARWLTDFDFIQDNRVALLGRSQSDILFVNEDGYNPTANFNRMPFLTVLELPACSEPLFFQAPEKVVLCPDSPGEFSVQVGGTNLAYTWFKDGVLLPDHTSSTLSLTSVTEADTGIYHCIIANDCGQDTSTEMDVKVEDPPTISYDLADRSVCTGLDFRLFFSPDVDNSYVNNWYRDGELIGSDNWRYFPQNIEEPGTYTYKCIAVTDCYKIESREATIIATDDVASIQLTPGSLALGLELPHFGLSETCVGNSYILGLYSQPDYSLFLDEGGVSFAEMPTSNTLVTFETSYYANDVPFELITQAWLLVAQHSRLFDFNGDGCNSVRDLYEFMEGWGNETDVDGDGDGRITILDALYVAGTNRENCP